MCIIICIMARKRKYSNNPKIRYTKRGTPIVMVKKIGKRLFLVEDFNGIRTLVAEEDLE